MKKLILSVLCVLLAASAFAQAPLVVPAPSGSNSLKAFHFKDYPALGIYSPSAGTMYIGGTSGGITFSDTGTSITGATLASATLTSATVAGSLSATSPFCIDTDACLSRTAAATLQIGLNAATAADQTIKGPNSTGNNIAGAILNIKGGDATAGNANGGQLALRGGDKIGTGEPGAVSIIDIGTKPTCDAARRGSIWYDQGGAGVADTFEVCAKQAAGDTYAWRALATIP